MSANATAFLDLLPDLSVWFFLKVAVGLFVAQVVFWFFRWRAIKGRLAQLPGESFGLLGPIPQMSKNLHRLFDWQVELQKKHGATYKATEAFWKDYAMVWTVDPRNIEHFLKTNFRNYVKPNSLRARLLEFIGQGIFRINHGHDDGEYPIWHSQRKIMSKIFFKKNFEGFLQKVFIRHSLVMNEVLNEAAQSGKVIDIQHLMFAFTLDSIAEIGFGTRFHALRKPMSVGDAFDYVQESAFLRLMRPLFSVPVLGKLLYPSERKFARLIKELNDFSYQTIRERRRTIAVAEAAKAASDDNADGSDDKQAMYGAEVGQDCLSLFMTSKAAKSAAFTDKQLRDIVMSVMIAGRDTTACTLTYCISELMQNPHVKEKLLAELQEKLSHTTLFGGSETVNQEELTQRNMPYLHGFVYEVRTTKLCSLSRLDSSNDFLWWVGVGSVCMFAR